MENVVLLALLAHLIVIVWAWCKLGRAISRNNDTRAVIDGLHVRARELEKRAMRIET